MGDPDERWASLFPALFEQGYVDYADCDLGFSTETVLEHLVSRLHLVARTPEGNVLVCRSDQGWRFLPGGTREDGETLIELATRELLEEAGARVAGAMQLFGAHVADSRRAEPFRTHLPHPRTYWAYGVVDVTTVGAPTNPADGEHVEEVLALLPDEAADYLDAHDRLHADVVRLAQAMCLVSAGK